MRLLESVAGVARAMSRGSLAAALILGTSVSPALAVTFLGFEHARPVEPQAARIGGASAVGSGETYSLFGQARLGLLPDLEAVARLGLSHFKAGAGFEAELGAKFRFLRVQDTRLVDLAVAIPGSILKSSDRFVFSMDPQVVASRHMRVLDRQVFAAGGLGLAFDLPDVDGQSGIDNEFGLLATLTGGIELSRDLQLAAEIRFRPDVTRFGLALSLPL